MLAQGERSVDELADEIDQTVANTSQHLQRLLRSGLVQSRRDGTRIFYSLSSPVVLTLWQTMRQAAEQHAAGLQQLAEDYLGDRSTLRSITRDQLRERLRDGDVVVLDVRPVPEYAAGHIRGAVSIPVDDLTSRLGEIPSGADVVAYCRGPYCVYADDAVRLLDAERVQCREARGRVPGVGHGRPTRWSRRCIRAGMNMGELTVHPVVDEGLGNTAYLVDLTDGRALVVDVSRDLRVVRAAAERRGLRIGWAADTHLHADFLTGARDLAAHDGATVLASAAGHRLFDHTGLADGDEVDLGGLHLRALGTPGHTDEHLAYLLTDGPRTLGVFTGGSLLVGAVARTDLVDPDRAEELARAQYRSVQRLLALPDDTPVWPTHGTGSFCSAPAGADRTTTVGTERVTNPLLAARDEDEFVARLLASLGSYPPYFRDLARDEPAWPHPVRDRAESAATPRNRGRPSPPERRPDRRRAPG